MKLGNDGWMKGHGGTLAQRTLWTGLRTFLVVYENRHDSVMIYFFYSAKYVFHMKEATRRFVRF